ncbi:FAD-dependent oxidoreductase, partial [Candidatus Micrarchaeota archaeon]|nr:FAD-dependent oxidoreductase [Candidatus Micrarchaeota archaeon]
MVMGSLATGTDVLIIGGGPGGYTAAIRCAQLGKDVILVEKANLGGICLNHGCIPAKALIHTANFLDNIKTSEKLGISIKDLSLDPVKLQAWKNTLVSQLRNGISDLCKKHGIEVIKGEAYFESSNKASVKTENGIGMIEFKNAIIA